MQSQRNAEDIVPGNAEEILVAAGLDRAYLRYAEGPCPICDGKTRFRWRAKTEDAFCNHCRHLGVFDLLKHLLNTDFRGACDFVRRWAGCGDQDGGAGVEPRPVRVAKPVPVEPDDTEKLKSKYRQLWSEGGLILPGTPAYMYVMRRAPKLKEIPRMLRAHPALPYWEEDPATGKFVKRGTYPGLLALAQGLNGAGVNVWRYYLTEDGGKADVPEVKKGAGRFLQPSYAVRLAEPEEDELGVAEGLESAWNVTATYQIPCWATLSADGMRKFDLPAGYEHVKKVRFFGDNDARDKFGRRAGNDAAHAAKDRMRAKGLISTVILPRFTSFDFADIGVKLAA